MTRYTLIIWLFFIFLSSSFATHATTLKVGVYHNPPSIFIDENDIPQGLFADLLNEIAKREQWTLDYQQGKWSELFEKLKHGEIDLLTSISYSEERARIFDFVESPVAVKWGTVYLPPDSKIAILPDLHEKRVAVLKGGIHGRNFRKVTQDFGVVPQIIETTSHDETLQLLEKGMVDAGVVNSTFGYLKEEHYRVERSAIAFHPTRSTFAAPQGKNIELLQTIDNYLKEWRKDKSSIYYQTYNNWYGGKEYKDFDYVLLAQIMFVMALIVFAGLFWLHHLSCLNRKISQAHNEMELLKQQAEDANQAKSEFLGIAAHDLKNPLSAIKGLAEEIQEAYDEMPREEVITYAEKIHDASQKMFFLITNLLDVNAIESGKMNINIVDADMLPIMTTLIEHYAHQAEAKNIKLQFHHDHECYLAQVDQNTVYQVFDNLISNAIKYSPHGKHVNVLIRHKNNKIRCEIQDQGPGLTAEDRRKLFGKFNRLSAKPTGGEHSTGLGLFIVKKLVEAMQGRVWCETKPGNGATFIVEFISASHCND